MERKDFLKAAAAGAGAIGIGSLLPFNRAKAAALEMTKEQILEKELLAAGACVATPAEMEGPFPLDLSNKPQFFRQDITEGRPGVPLNVTFTVLNFDTQCTPAPNIRVDAWQCDKDGLYSGYANQTGHNQPPQNLVGQTFMRGIQLTDANGEVKFKTIYPGWYPGRAVHIHMNFFVNSKKGFTTQAAFPDALTKTVFQNNPMYGGQADTTNATDQGIFSDGVTYQMFTIAPNSSGGYDASLVIAIKLGATLDQIDLEPESYRQLILTQNYPNPFNAVTTIPFKLTNPSDVTLDIYDLNGKKVHSLLNEKMSTGDHKFVLNNNANGLSLVEGSYVYQITINNAYGRYHQCKVLTVK